MQVTWTIQWMSSAYCESWRLVKTAYNDGGLSGATMERPGLRRLLADIGEKLIDVVVVYKVDLCVANC